LSISVDLLNGLWRGFSAAALEILHVSLLPHRNCPFPLNPVTAWLRVSRKHESTAAACPAPREQGGSGPEGKEAAVAKGSNTRIVWAERPRQGSNREKASSASQRKTGVLVVESQEMVRGLLQTALERQGFQTILTASGEEALEHSRRRSHPIDILLMDT